MSRPAWLSHSVEHRLASHSPQSHRPAHKAHVLTRPENALNAAWHGRLGGTGDQPVSTSSQRAPLVHGAPAWHAFELELALRGGGSMSGRLTGGCDGIPTTVVDGGLGDGSGRDSEAGRCSTTCTRGRKGRQKSCPWWTAAVRIGELRQPLPERTVGRWRGRTRGTARASYSRSHRGKMGGLVVLAGHSRG
jgi:hypothetical protein